MPDYPIDVVLGPPAPVVDVTATVQAPVVDVTAVPMPVVDVTGLGLQGPQGPPGPQGEPGPPGPPGTGEGGGGPHAATHSQGAADAVDVKNLAGYPGGTTSFLRADHTFAAPAAAAPTAHAATHNTAGSDPVTALSAAILTTGTLPDARLSGNVQMKPIAVGDLPAHATRHVSGGADPVTVTALAGYPGGTANFLRADGTFAAPPTGGTPSAHATTHQPGGSDALAVDAVAATGSLRTLGTGANQAAPGNDARFTAPSTPTAHATTHQSGGSDLLRLDTLAAPTDVTTLNASTSAHGLLPKLSGISTTFLNGTGAFTAPAGGGNVTGPASATTSNLASYTDTTGKVIKDSVIPSAQVARRDAVNTFTQNQAITGDLSLSGTITEQSRSAPLGHWMNVPNDPGNFSAMPSGTVAVSAYFNQAYMLVGGTCTYLFFLQLTISGAPTSLRIALPAGVVASNFGGGAFLYEAAAGMAQVTPGDTYLSLYRDTSGGTAWAAGAVFVIGTIPIPIY